VGIWGRIKAIADRLGSNFLGITVEDIRGAEKLPPRSSPPGARQIPLTPRPQPPGWEDAVDIGDLVYSDQRDIDDFDVPRDREDSLNWAYTWDMIPTGDMSDNQIQTAINQINDWLDNGADWESLWEEMREDFWDWYREQYSDG
jgi:hypothetical protein